MIDILHRVGILAQIERVYAALTTLDGLAGWWTDEVRGGTVVGETIHFQFGERGYFDMKILALEPGREVRWEVVGGPPEWIGTTVQWDLRQEDDYTILLFRHEGWREQVEFMHHCSTKWAIFLMSLKALLETGQGAAYPKDVKTDEWN